MGHSFACYDGNLEDADAISRKKPKTRSAEDGNGKQGMTPTMQRQGRKIPRILRKFVVNMFRSLDTGLNAIQPVDSWPVGTLQSLALWHEKLTTHRHELERVIHAFTTGIYWYSNS